MSIPLEHVEKIERLERDAGKTVGLLLGIVLACVLVFSRIAASGTSNYVSLF